MTSGMSHWIAGSGRLAAAHGAVCAAGVVVGVATGHLSVALAISLVLGLALHLAAQASLRRRTVAAELRYRSLVEELPAALYISSVDETRYALYVSPAIVDLLGYSIDEWQRKPRLFDEILHPLDRDDVLDGITKAKAEGAPYEAEYRLLRNDGNIVWVRDRAVTVRDAHGRPLHWQGFLVDVTERKQAEARFRTLAEQLPLITYIDTPYSSDEAAAYVSPQVEDILGYSFQEWDSSPTFFVDHLHPDDRERVRTAQRAARETGTPLETEYRFLANDGRVVWLQDSYTIVRDETGRPWYTQGYALDITARKQAEADREALLSRAQLQNERLRELDRMKDEFVALVSHELRTPLTSIRGYLELLLDESETVAFEPAHLEWLGGIDPHSERPPPPLEGLLLKAQGNAREGSPGVGEVALAAIVEQSALTAAPVAATRCITLATSAGSLPPVAADPVRIGQVIDNLISNALKFTPAGGLVELRAAVQDGRAVVEIADTGHGMSAAEQERLFERFYRTSRAQTDAVPGVGLGLSIAKAIVDAHGGTITCTSVEGEGSTFSIELPLASVATVAA